MASNCSMRAVGLLTPGRVELAPATDADEVVVTEDEEVTMEDDDGVEDITNQVQDLDQVTSKVWSPLVYNKQALLTAAAALRFQERHEPFN